MSLFSEKMFKLNTGKNLKKELKIAKSQITPKQKQAEACKAKNFLENTPEEVFADILGGYTIIRNPCKVNIPEIAENAKVDLINRLSSEFKSSYAKGEIGEVASREEIRKIIAHYGQLTSCYPDKRHLLAGEKTFISSSQYEDLADALVGKVSKVEGKECFVCKAVKKLADNYDEFGEVIDPECQLPDIAERIANIIAELIEKCNSKIVKNEGGVRWGR